jgi:nucleoside-diphosphate-sugar epimerase
LPGDPLVDRLANTATVHFGDVTRPETLAAPFGGVDVVYHLAAVLLCESATQFQAVNVEGTRHVVDAAVAAKVGHLVHISSASVVYPRTTHYSRSKRQAEEIVRACALLNWTVVRPTLVYDREGGLEFKMYADFVRRYPLLPMLAGGHARKRPVHVDDLLSGLASMAGNPITYGKTYNLSGGETLTLRELAALLLERQGTKQTRAEHPGQPGLHRRARLGPPAPVSAADGTHHRGFDPGCGPGSLGCHAGSGLSPDGCSGRNPFVTNGESAMKSNRTTKMGLLAVSLTACASMGKPPQGAEARLSADENAALARIRQKVDGAIVWSSSRLGNHDIFLMKTDGTGVKALTSGEQVDWYPRFSPDGKQILFVRSKKGWVSEQDANRPEKWDQYVMDREGGNLHHGGGRRQLGHLGGRSANSDRAQDQPFHQGSGDRGRDAAAGCEYRTRAGWRRIAESPSVA